MTSNGKHPGYGAFPDRPPVFSVDEADEEAAIGVARETTPIRTASTEEENKSNAAKANKQTSHVGMLGDGTEEQSLDQPGDPSARIKKDEVDAAFGDKP